MNRKLVLKKCEKCGALVRVINGNSNMQCCGETMKEIVPNSVDAAFEKHVPTYEVKENKILVTVNHVMEEEHYIEWIAMVTDTKECIHYCEYGKEATCHFKYVPGAKLYAYCNKHGLWEADVK